jgi:hypothetical protein
MGQIGRPVYGPEQYLLMTPMVLSLSTLPLVDSFVSAGTLTALSQLTLMAKKWLLGCTANSRKNATIVAKLATNQLIVALRRATTKRQTEKDVVEGALAT